MNHRPTPETDSWIGHGIGGLEVVPASRARDLERRLTIARDALKAVSSSCLNIIHAEIVVVNALELTKPKI